MTAAGLQALVVILLLFCAWHARGTLGPRMAAALLAITVVTSWVLEELGVATGLVFGPYHYTSALGPSIGSVPVLIPLAWFALAYPTWVLVDLVVARWAVGPSWGRGRLAGLALVGAVVMTAWDLALDPILSGPAYRAWLWEGGGVPFQNYVGWFATAFAIFIVARLFERRAAGAGATPGPGQGVASEPGMPTRTAPSPARS